MSLTLQNFDKTEDPDVTARGLDYFNEKAVSSLDEIAEGQWESSVMGTDLYSVAVNLKKNKIDATGCDCRAFAKDNYCKHVAAVLFAIRNKLDNESGKAIKIKKAKAKTASQILHDIVDQSDEKELRNFIKNYAAHNKDFTDELLLSFRLQQVVNNASEEGFKELVKFAIDNSTTKNMVDAEILSKHLVPISLQAEKYITDSNFLEAFYIIKSIFELLSPLLGTLPYSFRESENAFTKGIGLLERMASLDIPPMFRDDLFDYCLSLSDRVGFAHSDYDRRIDQLLPVLASGNSQREQILRLIDKKLEELIPKGSKSATTPNLNKHLVYVYDKIALLEQLHKHTEAGKFLRANIFYHDALRHAEIKKAIENKNAGYARELIDEKLSGHSVKVDGHWYNADRENEKWQPYYLDIAIVENDVANIQLYAEKLFKTSHQIGYYNILKQYTPADKWHKKFEEIESSLFRKHYSFGILAIIYISEGKTKDLFELLKRHAYLGNIHDTIAILLPAYGREVLALYNKALITLLNHGTVADYKEAMEHLQYLLSLGQKETVQNWIETFKSIYSNRPRLIKELRKLEI